MELGICQQYMPRNNMTLTVIQTEIHETRTNLVRLNQLTFIEIEVTV